MKQIIRKFLFITAVATPVSSFSQGQCLAGGCAGPGNSFGAAQSTTYNTFVAAVAGTWAGEYNTFNVTNGMQYEWSLCTADGATAGSANPQLTLKTTGNVNICFSDDFCGNQPKIQWTATFTGQVRVFITTFNCATSSVSHTIMWRCVTCVAPVGTNCGNSHVIASVPFSQSGLTTCGYANDYTSANACASSYMNGEDYVFSYTPAANICVNIALTNTLTYTGVFVTNGCPNTGSCVAQNTNFAGNPSITNVNLTSGVTYYIIVDTWPTPNCTPFDISISACGVTPAGSNCGNAIVIPSMPYSQNGLTTCGFGNDYTSLNACGSVYMNGEDFLFTYTPAANECINIALTGTSSYTGVFVTNGCPNIGSCVGQATNSVGNPVLNNVSLTAGVTYYIIIDTWPAPNCTPFNIDITVCIPPVSAGDCPQAVNVCTNYNFAVDPSGYGLVDELCIGCLSNPSINPASTNSGCLLDGELNSTWMVVNVATSGTLEFSFGTAGGSVCYDWIMWPYTPGVTCTEIQNNLAAPIRCNWNFPCEGFTGMGALPPGGTATNFEPLLNVTAGQQFIICFSNYSSAVTTVPLNFYGTADISCTVLPVELVDFYGNRMHTGNLLTWKTASEQHNSHFTIEKSTDGNAFSFLGKVPGSENSLSLQTYNLVDENPVTGTNYYRLLQTDLNGTSHNLNTIVIDNELDNAVVGNIYPNPSDGSVTVPVQVNKKGNLLILVTDITGKEIFRQPYIITEGSHKLLLLTNTLSKGTYTVFVQDENGMQVSVQPFVRY